MKNSTEKHSVSQRPKRADLSLLLIGMIAMLFAACGSELSVLPASPSGGTEALLDPCSLVLAPLNGTEPIDREIARLQQEVKGRERTSIAVERLGWKFVEKARLSYDAGYYNLAEQSGRCIERMEPESPAAMLLQGHALHSLHRFQEAEAIARSLVAKRGIPFDHGLLGDILMDEGKIQAAAAAYQSMVDMRPDLHSYSRAAHLRWFTGDIKGAIELIQLAAGGGSPRDSDSAAWVYTRLALYQLESGNLEQADLAVAQALGFRNTYAPALLVKGRILLARNRPADAIGPLRLAANQDRLPEYLWTLAEALGAAGQQENAQAVESDLVKIGEREDPRTYALFLATRRLDPNTALALAIDETGKREDVFTKDTLAWALRSVGRTGEASVVINKALSARPNDARILFHSGVIAAELGRRDEARSRLYEAKARQQMLLPSEREILARELAAS